MPKENKKRPEGQEPGTGRAAGFRRRPAMSGPCYPHGMGFSRARGPFMGKSWRHRHWHHAGCHPGWIGYDMDFPCWGSQGMPDYQPGMEPDEEKEFLEAQAAHLKDHLEEIEKRMGELKKTKEKK